MTSFNHQIEQTLAIHFDPKWGAPYWIERAKSLPFDPRNDIRKITDLTQFDPFPLDELARRPVQHFIPKKFHKELHRLVTTETGGTTGPPKCTAFLASEFEAAFVTPFLEAARLIGFPRNVNWLFIGPTGPHAIGKAARACAMATGSIDPFTVDFDPRWARKLPPASFARERYLAHVLEQAQAVLSTQEVGVLFATPPVLAALGQQLDPKLRMSISGIHLGGMAASDTFWTALTEDWFPNARVMAGYGNSLMGMCPQLTYTAGETPSYFAHGARLYVGVEASEGAARSAVRFHRLDQSCFLPNVIERDEALPVPNSALGIERGFAETGIRDPRPPEYQKEKVEGGLY